MFGHFGTDGAILNYYIYIVVKPKLSHCLRSFRFIILNYIDFRKKKHVSKGVSDLCLSGLDRSTNRM